MRSCEHLLGAPGTAKMRRWSAPVLGSEIWTPKQGPVTLFSYDDGPHFGVQNSDPKIGSSWMVFLGASACQKFISARKSMRLHCMLGRACILLLQADCHSQVRASANWGGPSQRDRFLCRFSAPVLGSSDAASFVARQLVAAGGV